MILIGNKGTFHEPIVVRKYQRKVKLTMVSGDYIICNERLDYLPNEYGSNWEFPTYHKEDGEFIVYDQHIQTKEFLSEFSEFYYELG